jgi:hypothetical protein
MPDSNRQHGQDWTRAPSFIAFPGLVARCFMLGAHRVGPGRLHRWLRVGGSRSDSASALRHRSQAGRDPDLQIQSDLGYLTLSWSDRSDFDPDWFLEHIGATVTAKAASSSSARCSRWRRWRRWCVAGYSDVGCFEAGELWREAGRRGGAVLRPCRLHRGQFSRWRYVLVRDARRRRTQSGPTRHEASRVRPKSSAPHPQLHLPAGAPDRRVEVGRAIPQARLGLGAVAGYDDCGRLVETGRGMMTFS